MLTKFDSSGTINGLKQLLDNMLQHDNIKSLIILGANNDEFTSNNLDPILKNIPVPVIGGIYTAVVFNQQVHHKGTIVMGLSVNLESVVIPHLSDENADYDDSISNLIEKNPSFEYDTMFVFADGYSSQLGNLVESLFNVFGINCNFIGGGAGYYHPEKEMKSKPCVLTNDGIVADSAVLGMAKLNSTIEVEHGWEKISKPFRITESKGKAVNSIDWQPAFQYYCQFLEKHSGKQISSNNFFDIGKGYSLGLSRISSNIIVREPIGVSGQSLMFTVPIPNESIVYILKGDTKPMVQAAKKAAKICTKDIDTVKNKAIFLVDCISRYYFQGNDFKKELNAVAYKKVPMIGILTIGEIANTGKSYIELYNKTCVVGLING